VESRGSLEFDPSRTRTAQITAIYPDAANRLTIRQLVGTCKAVRLSLPRRLQLLRIEDEERIGSLIAND
jgi:hypothetical protein